MTRLEEIRFRLSDAEPGPWDWREDWIEEQTCPNAIYEWSEGQEGRLIASNVADPDADFIAHAREDVEWLLEKIEAVRTLAKGILSDITNEELEFVDNCEQRAREFLEELEQ